MLFAFEQKVISGISNDKNTIWKPRNDVGKRQREFPSKKISKPNPLDILISKLLARIQFFYVFSVYALFIKVKANVCIQL